VSARKPVVAIIGTGLLGTSLALAMKKSGFCASTSGYSRKTETIEQAIAAGAIDIKLESLSDTTSADIVILAAPVGAIVSHLRELGSLGYEGSLIIDVGSTKAGIIKTAVEAGLGSRFVGGHPMAGSEKSGPVHASSDLFRKKVFFLTPTEETSEEALQTAQELVKATGARIVEIDADEHDRTVALTSHLPYLLAAALSKLASEQSGVSYVREAMAGAFKSATRLADGSPEMWGDILLDNTANIKKWLEKLHALAGDLLAAAENPDKLKSALHGLGTIPDRPTESPS
jgi:prephenate dehydrogenase